MKDKKSAKKSKAQILQEKKQKAKLREENLKTLKTCAIDPKLSEVLISSKDFGKHSIKNSLTLELKREKLGLSFDSHLHQQVKTHEEGFQESEFPKVPIYHPKEEFDSESSKSSEVREAQIKFNPKLKLKLKPKPESPASNQEPYMPTETPQLDPMVLMGYSTVTCNADCNSGSNQGKPQSQTLLEASLSLSQGTNPTTTEPSNRDETLPIIHMEQEIIETIKEHPVTIICGETGCGKSTQLPRFLIENGLVASGKVGITQPRRIAAVTLARRVAEETGFRLGDEIGYQVRYDSSTVSSKTKIKFMTDGILLKELGSDFLLKDYSVIIIDEAHERGINTDILIALLSRVIRMRKENPLKLVIMSATIRVEDFTNNPVLFDSPPVINIDARQFPVSLHFAKETKSKDYLELSYQKVLKIHKNLPHGGVLVFLPGKKDVLELKRRLKATLPRQETSVQGLYSMLPLSKQVNIFSPPADKRLIVISTNVAETSVTIPGIAYVVDSGLEKRKVFSDHLQMSKFIISFISQASASQRAGRAGRTGPGHCYRLYSSAAFHNVFSQYREADISCFPLSPTILQLKSIGIKNVYKFPFPTPPPAESLSKAIEELCQFGALRQCRKGEGDVFEITDCGKKLAKLPLAPRYSKMMIQAQELNVLEEMSVIVAALEVDQVFDTFSGTDDKKRTAESKRKRSDWFKGKSDLICTVRMVESALKAENLAEFCAKFGVIEKSLKEVMDLALQVYGLATEQKLKSLSELRFKQIDSNIEVRLQKSIVAGFVDQICARVFTANDTKLTRHVPYLCSKTLDPSMFSSEYLETEVNKEHVFIHPTSYFFSRSPPELLAYQHLVFTQRPSIINLTEVQTDWLHELGAYFIQDARPESDTFAVYDHKADCIKTRVIAGYGKQNWKLPATLAVYPEIDTKYFHMAKFVMDGTVFCNDDIKKFWKGKVLKFSGKMMVRIMRKLKARGLDCLKKLVDVVKMDQKFLIQEFVDCAKDEFVEQVREFWKIVNLA